MDISIDRWWWHDDIWRVTLQFMGASCKTFHLEKGLKKLSASENLRKEMLSTSCEYLSLEGRQINENKEKFGTGRSVSKEEFLSYYVNFENPPLGLCQSLWQKDYKEEARPERVIFYFDIEYFNNYDMKVVLLNQEEIITSVEPVYRLIREVLLNLAIDHQAILSGRGYNFISSVPSSSPLFNELIKIGGTIEPTLEEKQKHPSFKRQRPVLKEAELSFKGMLRLIMFLSGMIISEARKRSSLLPVEMSDQGYEGISLDPTMLTRSIDTSNCAVSTSPYLKFHFQKKLPPEIVYNTTIPVRLIRARGEKENFIDLKTMIRVRNDYNEAIVHFSEQEGFIPDGSKGLCNLINLYKKSPMAHFHNLMDTESHDPCSEWWRTYRNYDIICKDFSHLEKIIRNPNPALLQPDNLDHLINDFMDAGWHPKHIGGFLRSIYEDDFLGQWGTRFWKYDAAKWANGWVEILGAQRYFGLE